MATKASRLKVKNIDKSRIKGKGHSTSKKIIKFKKELFVPVLENNHIEVCKFD